MEDLIRIFLSSGYGYGDGINAINGNSVYVIDGVETIIRKVHVEDTANGVAVGRILKGDLTTEITYVVKRNFLFAHGRTLDEAVEAVNAKVLQKMPVEERVEAFVKAFPLVDTFVSGRDLFRWHNMLTGSCEQGRMAFCESKGLDLDHEYTIAQFIAMTINAYGGEVIRQLKERYERIG